MPPPPEPESPKLPPRHRSNKDSLASDSSERGFWDLDDLGEDSLPPPAAAKIEPRLSTPRNDMPEPAPSDPTTGLPSKSNMMRRMSGVERFKEAREAKAKAEAAVAGDENKSEDSFVLETAASPAAPKEAWEAPKEIPTKALHDEVFEGFEEEPPTPDTGRIELTLATTLLSDEPDHPPVEDSIVAPATKAVAPAPPAAPADPEDEFAPAVNPDAKPLSLRPHLKLSPLETIGLACLALALLVGGVWAYRHTLNRIGHTDASHGKVEYPVKGSHVTVTGVVSYWRAPITTGDKPEIVRRGVVLIPVVEITLSGGPGAVRILFNSEHGKKAGDPITRTINGATTLVIPATDGFEDISMHAAYRTESTNPWMVEIAEAPSENSPGSQFKTLLKAPISPEKR